MDLRWDVIHLSRVDNASDSRAGDVMLTLRAFAPSHGISKPNLCRSAIDDFSQIHRCVVQSEESLREYQRSLTSITDAGVSSVICCHVSMAYRDDVSEMC